jgi:hypothetical protein
MPAPIGRVVFQEHRVDPIIAAADGEPGLARFFIRTYAEALPLNLLPGNTITDAAFRAFQAEPECVQLPGWNEEIMARVLRPEGTGSFRHTFYVPAGQHERMPVSFFWKIEGDAGSVGRRGILGTLEGAQPSATTGGREGAKNVSLANGPAAFVLSPQTQHGFLFLGSNGLYTVGFTVGAISGTPPVLHGAFVPQVTTLTLESRGAFALTAIVDMIQLQPTLMGHTSGDHREGELAFVFEGKMQVNYCMRLMCALAAHRDAPVSMRPQLPPIYSNFRSTLLHVAEQRWDLDTAQSQTFAHGAVVVLVGDLTGEVCLALFRGYLRPARVVGVITARRKLYSELSQDQALERCPPLDGCPRFAEQRRELIVLETSAYEVHDDRAERFLLSLQARHVALSGESMPAERDDMLAARLPALPICKDNFLDAIGWLLLANAHRGRVPPDSTRLVDEIFDDDAYWLFPLRADRSDRWTLLAQLAGRITAEYLAARAAPELGGTVFRHAQPAPPERLAEAADLDALLGLPTPALLLTLFRRWQRGMDAWSAPRTMAQLIGELERRGLVKERFLRELARAAYDVLMGERVADERRLTHFNPLVIAAIPMLEGEYDAGFHKEVAGLAMFAARRSAMKPGGVAVVGVHAALANAVRDRQKAVRMLLRRNLTPELADEIAIHRLMLGEICKAGCAMLALPLLDTLDADRLVLFSNLPLEFIPYGDSLLGLEYAAACYPASISVYDVMTLVAQGRQRVQEMRDRRAAILCAPRGGSDPVVEWANEIGAMFDPLTNLLGMDAVYPVAGADNAGDVLAAAANSSLVLFAGHGFAADGSAGLDVGAFTLSYQDILAQSWTGSVVLLFACESGAADAMEGDLASAFLMRGARGVIATTAPVRLDIADQVLGNLVRLIQRRLPLDYLFHLIRQRVVLFELFQGPFGEGLPITLERAMELAESKPYGFGEVLRLCNIDRRRLLSGTSYALTFKLYGGLSERIG